jgi:hypothetical protein
MSETKEYLGDSVYIDLDDCGGIVLTTENGIGPTNTIIMEPEVVRQLIRWAKRMQAENKLSDRIVW